MTTLKALFVASVIAIGLAAPASAQQSIFVPNNSLLMVDASGHATVTEAGKLAHATMMRKGKPVGEGVILYMNEGRLYMMTDKKMAGGKMLSAMFMEDRQLQGRF